MIAADCPVCLTRAQLLDVVDLNKACLEGPGRYLPLAGVPIYYAWCPACAFTFAPQMAGWPLEEFESRIYNRDYVNFDPEYVQIRPEKNANLLVKMFGTQPALRHLDFGGGSGLLSQTLRSQGWQSQSYDPFVDKNLRICDLGRFDLITAFEVFEHVPDVQGLMRNLLSLRSESSLFLFSTLVSDGHLQMHQRISWWYASPRNGHISLFSKRSLAVLAEQHQLSFGSFSDGLHVFFEQIPAWAAHLIR